MIFSLSKLMTAHTTTELALAIYSCKDKAPYVEVLEILKYYIDENNLDEFLIAYKSAINWHDEFFNIIESEYSKAASEIRNRAIKQSRNIAFAFLNLTSETTPIQYRLN